MTKKSISFFSLFFLLICSSGCVSDSSESLDSIREGRTIFRKGSETSGVLVEGHWTFNREKVSVKGAALACAGCHAVDGKGGSEAGIFSADIRAKTLFSKKLDKDGNFIREKYNFQSLMALLETGADPNGNIISELMPRFSLSKSQKKEIYAYLSKLGEDFDPGVTDSEIKIAFLGESRQRSDLAIETFRFYFSKNFPLGIFGRKVKVEFVSDKTIDELERSYFLIISDGTAQQRSHNKNIDLQDTPILSSSPQIEENIGLENSYFSIFPSPRQEGKIIGKYFNEIKSKKIGFVSDNTRSSKDFVIGVEESLGKKIIDNSDSSELDYLIVLTEKEIENNVRLNKKTIFIYPSWIRVKEANSLYLYPMSLKIDEQFIPKEFVKSTNRTTDLLKQIKAYTISQLISSALSGSGPALSRPGFISALRKININNNLVPPVSFNRENFGIRGAYLIDVKNRRQLGWIEP